MARGKVQRAAVEPVDGPWALPDGWRWKRLDDVAPVNPRRPLNALADDEEIAFVGMASVEAETGRIDVTNTRNARQVRQGFTRFAPGDVLFAKITPCMENGKVAIVPEIPRGVGVGSTEFHVFGTNGVLPEYLYYWVSQRSFRETAEFHMTGTAGQKRVPPDFLRDCPIPVPELDIQHRIVAHVAELFAEIDDGEAALERARGDLATWRKALLKAAVTGELTADWRAANPPTETGADLLARILAERRTRWLAEPRNRGKRYIEPEGLETPVQVTPDGWGLTGAGPLLTWASGKFLPDRLMSGAAIPVYGGNGIAGHHHEWLVDRPTLVIGRVGFYCGNAYVTDGPAWITDNAIYASSINASVDPRFIRIVFEQANLRVRAQGGAQPFVSQGLLNSVAIPLPGLSEQEQIVETVDSLMNEAVALAEATSVLGEGSATLRQSILAAAFRGDLVA